MENETSTPIYEDIEKALRKEISEGEYKPYERFLSEVKLSKRFKVNAATARKAVDRLVMEGLLYKVPSSGTFIAPPRKNRMILIVIPAHTHSLISHCSVEEFIDTPYCFQEVHATEYLRHSDDILLLYPELAGIIFYRDSPKVSHTFSGLEEKGVKFIVYGSSTLQQILKNRASLFYSENTIISKGMDHLTAQGCKNIGIVYNGDWPAAAERFRQYLRWMKANRQSPDPELMVDVDTIPHSSDAELYPHLVALFSNGTIDHADGLLCASDYAAALIIQAAKETGKRIPEELKILGINNEPICEVIQPTMSAVDLPIHEDSRRAAKSLMDMIEGKSQIPKLHSNITVVQRQSTSR